jgi:ferredoxin, 2Fe-2S
MRAETGQTKPILRETVSMIKVTYIESNGATHVIEAEDGSTVMEAAIRNSIPEIVAECGGACACATCHVYVDEAFLPITGKADPKEEDMLDFAYAAQPNSRLSCQIKLTPALNGLIVRTPARQG